MTSPLATLQNFRDFSQHLVELAGSNNWAALGEKVGESTALFSQVKAALNQPLSPQDRPLAKQLISEILANHQRISSRATPWLEDVRQLLEKMS